MTASGRHPPAARGVGLCALVVGVVLAAALGGCSAHHATEDPLAIAPSYHSAGPDSRDQLQAVLDAQAESIQAADWRRYYELYVPSERERCQFEDFLQSAEQSFGQLRDQAQGGRVAARLLDARVSGFRAAVEYQLLIPEQLLATPDSTAHYLKLGDRWFLDDKAC